METFPLNILPGTLRDRPAALDCIADRAEEYWPAYDEHPAVAAGKAHRINKRHGKRNG